MIKIAKVFLILLLIGALQCQKNIFLDIDFLLQTNSHISYATNGNGLYAAYVLSKWDRDTDTTSYIVKSLNLVDYSEEIIHKSMIAVSNLQFYTLASTGVEYLLLLIDGQINFQAFPKGQVIPFTNFPIQINSFKISKQTLVFSVDVYPKFGSNLFMTKQENDRVEKIGPNTFNIYEHLMVREGAAWYKGKLTKVFTHNLDSVNKIPSLIGEPTNIIPAELDYLIDDYDVSPDGNKVIYTVHTKDQYETFETNWKTYLINLVNNDVIHVSKNATGRTQGPKFSPTGRVFVLAMARPGLESDNLNLFEYNASNESLINFSNFDDSIASYSFLNNNEIVVNSTIRAVVRIGYISLLEEKPQVKILTDTYDLLSASTLVPIKFTKNILTVKSSLSQFPELHLVEVRTSNLTTFSNRITRNNYFANDNITLSRFELFEFDSTDKLKVQGILVFPFGFTSNKKYPFVLQIHGGPEAAWTTAFGTTYNNANLVAGIGYAVVLINPRGSTGYGQNFVDKVRGDWGNGPLDDLIQGINYLTSKYPWIDNDKKCAMGGSYGGYMINWMRGKLEQKDRFNCYITHAGVFNTRQDTYSTDQLWFNLAEFCPKDNIKCRPYEEATSNGFDKFSPESLINNWDNAPHLIIHGQRDYRLTWSNGNAMFTALQLRNVPSQYLFFKEESHSIRRKLNQKMWVTTVTKFIKENIDKKPDAIAN